MMSRRSLLIFVGGIVLGAVGVSSLQTHLVPAASKPSTNKTPVKARVGEKPGASASFVTSRSSSIDPLSKAALTRRQKGEAMLDQDIPSIQRLRERALQQGVNFAMLARAEGYKGLFTAYGLDEPTQEKLMGHVAAIFEARMALQNNATQLINARTAYENLMKDLLGNAVGEYERYEALDPARRQYEDFGKFAQAKNVPLDPAEQSKIVSLIYEHGAYTNDIQTGPGGVFQDWPQPMKGVQAVAVYELQKATLEQQKAALLVRAEKEGLSLQARSALDAYYTAGIASYDDQLALFSGDRNNPRLAELRRNAAMRAAEARAKAQAKPMSWALK